MVIGQVYGGRRICFLAGQADADGVPVGCNFQYQRWILRQFLFREKKGGGSIGPFQFAEQRGGIFSSGKGEIDRGGGLVLFRCVAGDRRNRRGGA